MGRKVINLSTNKIYDSVKSACIEFKIKQSTLSSYLSGKRKNKTFLKYYGERYIDLAGKKFGKWTVIEREKECGKRTDSRWLCRCECGNIRKVLGFTIRHGTSMGCSMCKSTKKDMIGFKVGKLTVIEEAGKNKRNNFYWLCKCECGKTSVVHGCALRSAKILSCGCLKGGAPREGNRRIAIYKHIYTNFKTRNKRYNAEMISFSDFIKLTELNCHYCNSIGSNSYKDDITDEIVLYTGLDQIVPGNGYAKNNSLPCCKFCNSVKNDMSQYEFRNHVIKIYNFWNERITSDEFEDNSLSYQGKSTSEIHQYKKTQRRIDRKLMILNRAYTKIKNRFNGTGQSDKKDKLITFDHFSHLSYGNCFYCGGTPNKILRDRIKNSNEIIYVNGIDRINSSQGYIDGNVRSCCKRCNQAKMELCENDFKKLIINIYNHWASK